MVTIFHHPRCSKSRATLALLRERGIEPEIRLYLDTPPSALELRGVLNALGIGPRDLLRKNEAAYKDLGLAADKHSDQQLIDLMCAHPIVIERPIVINGERAAIGRPPETVLAIL